MDGRKEYFLLGVFVLNLLLNAFCWMPPQLLYCQRNWTIILHLPSPFGVSQTAIISLCSHLFFPNLKSLCLFNFFLQWNCSVSQKRFFFAFYCSSLFFSSQTKASRKPYTGMPWLKVYLMLLCAKIISFWLLEITRSFWKEEKNWSGLQEH